MMNNSIVDFMRFKKGNSSNSCDDDDDDDRGVSSTAELQTVVVTYRKKFPWSLLQPFLHV